MTRRTNYLGDELYRYLVDVSVREPDVLRRLREETAALPNANMQIGPEQGQFMALLVELIGAQHTLEIGTFTGYSALAVAMALPFDGRVIACDLSEEWTSVGRPFWEEAGQAHKIEVRLGPALDTLDGLIAEGKEGYYDFAFIDADKTAYPAYFERCLQLVRRGGLIAIDNTLWEGKVVDAEVMDDDTEAIRSFNAALREDHRVSLSLVPIGDGLTLAKKR
jgi:predicted O-methyltransferase YrrM